jgi:hypothetical protein
MRAMVCCRALVGLLFAAAAAVGCSPGTLPGTPSELTVGGGGARYNGTLTVRRVGGAYTINELGQPLVLSLVMRGADQFSGRIEFGGTVGLLAGTLNGNLNQGSFQATILLSTAALSGGTTTLCDGKGDVTGTLSGVNLALTSSSVTYDNCPGLTTSTQAQAVAVSPIPGVIANRANVVISIVGGTRVAAGTCPGGVPGFPFTVEIAETAGINVTLDSRFTAEERRGDGALSVSTLDMPFTDLPGGQRRTYGACSLAAGTYQAFVSGIDASGNRIRAASPVISLGS